MEPVTLEVLIERKHPDLAAFVIVPASAVAAWGLSATTTIEGTLDGIPLGRRSLRRWNDDRWFVELRKETLELTAPDGMPACTSVRLSAIQWSA